MDCGRVEQAKKVKCTPWNTVEYIDLFYCFLNATIQI